MDYKDIELNKKIDETKLEKLDRTSRELAYKGSIFNFYKDHIVSPKGHKLEFDFIGHNGAAAVLPVLDDGTILLVRQWRNAIDRFALELPAGGKDSPEETTISCAARELEEETGFKSEDLEFLQTIVPAIAYSQETIDIYVARNLQPSKQNLDPDEYINVERYDIHTLLKLISENKIQDSKTAAAITNYYCKYCL